MCVNRSNKISIVINKKLKKKLYSYKILKRKRIEWKIKRKRHGNADTKLYEVQTCIKTKIFKILKKLKSIFLKNLD